MTNTEQEIQKTKDRILTAALKEFAEKGYDGARMNAIAKRSGINQALIHYHFQSKSHLYMTILERFFAENRFDPIIDYMNRKGLSPSQKLYLIIHVLVHFHTEHIDVDIYRIFNWEIARKGEHFKAFLKDYIIPQTGLIIGIINEGILRGDFKTVNPLIITLNLLMMPDLVTPYWKDVISGTEWYDMLYTNPAGGDFFTHMVNLTFKTLSPAEDSCKVPSVPDDVMEGLNALLASHDDSTMRG